MIIYSQDIKNYSLVGSDKMGEFHFIGIFLWKKQIGQSIKI